MRPAAAGRASIEEEGGVWGARKGGRLRAARAARAARAERLGRAGTRETVHGDEPAGRVGGVTVRCATKRYYERLWGESEGFVWIDELYLIFKQEESSVRAQSARAVGAWA